MKREDVGKKIMSWNSQDIIHNGVQEAYDDPDLLEYRYISVSGSIDQIHPLQQIFLDSGKNWHEFIKRVNQDERAKESLDKALWEYYSENTILFDHEWECLTEWLAEEINKRDTKNLFKIEVVNFGWQKRDGVKYDDLKIDRNSRNRGEVLLSCALPETDNTFVVYDYRNGEGLAINNVHHDSPYGDEWYYITPIYEEENQ